MTIRRHPAPEYLMSCAAGSMPEALAAVMASHMSMCPRCRRELSVLDLIGGALLADIRPEELASKEPFINLERDDPLLAQRHPQTDSDVPMPLQPFVGPALEAVAWQDTGDGIRHYPIPLAGHSRAALRLVKVEPGHKLPDRGAVATEFILVLHGVLLDASATYVAGDLIERDEADHQSLTAGQDSGCVCLIASESPGP